MTTTVHIGRDFAVPEGLHKQVWGFVTKLTENPAHPSLRIKPLQNSADSRVRTGRVTDKYRAVLIELEGSTQRVFLLVKVDNHDEAIDYAAKLRVKANEVNGVIDFLTDTPVVERSAIQDEIESRAKRLAAEKLAAMAAEQPGTPQPTKLAQRAPREILDEAGVSPTQLEEELGISAFASEALATAASEEELLGLIDDRPDWEKDALLGVLAGMSVAEVRDDLGLDQPGTQDDEDLIEKVQRSTDWVAPSEEELREILETGSFGQWRVFLHPSQAAVVNADHKGSGRVLGGAGTGKTVVLVHRAKRLLDESEGQARVLLTTYTRALANQLKSQMTQLDPEYSEAVRPAAPGLWIAGVDSLIRQVLTNARPDEIAGAAQRAFGTPLRQVPAPSDSSFEGRAWREAIAANDSDLDSTKLQPEFLSDELTDIVLTNSITEEKDYLRVKRTGRGTSLNRQERKIVWNIIQSFLRKCLLENKLPYAAIAVLGAEVLEQRQQPLFDHVLIDEAQDFHAGHWRFLRASVAPGANDIFLAEDAHQRIYGHRLSLRDFGIETRGGATKRLTVNYRTTAENLAYASAVLEGTEWVSTSDETDTLTGYRSLRRGPAPIIYQADNDHEEEEFIVNTVRTWLEEDLPSLHIGVLVRNRARIRQLTELLTSNDIDVSTARSGASVLEATVSVMTMHNAKGMEFTHVILSNVGQNVMPQAWALGKLADAEREDALQRERALLFVASSRARDQLVITTVGEPSELLPRVGEEEVSA